MLSNAEMEKAFPRMQNPDEVPAAMYQTTNSAYGLGWEKGGTFPKSFTRSATYRQVTNRRQVCPEDIPKDRHQLANVHDPQNPCGIMTMSNVPMDTPLGEVRGEFTNVRRDLYTDRQGMWSNAVFNTPGATIDHGRGTYSNLQGAWSRVGPSTYDATHGRGAWVRRWRVDHFEPAVYRSMVDHRNVDPRDNIVPIEPFPQNQANGLPPC